MIIALARPQQGTRDGQVQASGIDIMLALDVSRSMLAEDFTIGNSRANRLEAVKQVTEKFIKAVQTIASASSPLPADLIWSVR